MDDNATPHRATGPAASPMLIGAEGVCYSDNLTDCTADKSTAAGKRKASVTTAADVNHLNCKRACTTDKPSKRSTPEDHRSTPDSGGDDDRCNVCEQHCSKRRLCDRPQQLRLWDHCPRRLAISYHDGGPSATRRCTVDQQPQNQDIPILVPDGSPANAATDGPSTAPCGRPGQTPATMTAVRTSEDRTLQAALANVTELENTVSGACWNLKDTLTSAAVEAKMLRTDNGRIKSENERLHDRAQTLRTENERLKEQNAWLMGKGHEGGERVERSRDQVQTSERSVVEVEVEEKNKALTAEVEDLRRTLGYRRTREVGGERACSRVWVARCDVED